MTDAASTVASNAVSSSAAPQSARILPAQALAEAQTALVRETQILASLGDGAQPLPKESHDQWQLRREKIAHIHETIPSLRAAVAQAQAEVTFAQRQQEELARRLAKEQRLATIENYRHLCKLLLAARADLERADLSCLSLNIQTCLPYDWRSKNYLPGIGMNPPPGWDGLLEGSQFNL